VTRELGVGYGTLRRLLEREIDEEALGFIQDEDEIYLGIDEHSFRHQEMVHTVIEVKARRVLGILRDDRIATLKKFLSKTQEVRAEEVCIDMKDGLRKAAEALFPLARIVVDPFHVIADSNKRMVDRLFRETRPCRNYTHTGSLLFWSGGSLFDYHSSYDPWAPFTLALTPDGDDNLRLRVVADAVVVPQVTSNCTTQLSKPGARGISGAAPPGSLKGGLADMLRGSKIRLANTQGDESFRGDRVEQLQEFAEAHIRHQS
jgi:hypothetical protein